MVAGPGGQDAERPPFGETGLAQAVDDVVDRAVAPGDNEQALGPLPGGLAGVAGPLRLDPIQLIAVELGPQHLRVVGTAARRGVADHPCCGPSHRLKLLGSLTSALVYPERATPHGATKPGAPRPRGARSC